MAADGRLPEQGFAWLDVPYKEAHLVQAEVERLTGLHIVDVHIADAVSLSHPSFFDNTDTYEIVVFAGLSPQSTVEEIDTRPMTFFNFDKLLVTVRASDSRSVAQVRSRYLNLAGKTPQSPDDLMQRLLSAMFDHYLELRQPLAQRLDAWQRQLLDPSMPFHDWPKLLESRRQIRKLQDLSEEQRDAIQEWRDYRIADLSPAMHARFADIVEHIDRVNNHARTIPEPGRVGGAALLRRNEPSDHRDHAAAHVDHGDFHAAHPHHRRVRDELRCHPGAAPGRWLLACRGRDDRRRRRHAHVLPLQALALMACLVDGGTG
jgi:Mg2+ and Co2+ transporter CorA